MVTNPVEQPEPDRLAEARIALESGLREGITGSSSGSIRLYVLMALVAVALLFTPYPVNIVGLIAYVALILDGRPRPE